MLQKPTILMNFVHFMHKKSVVFKERRLHYLQKMVKLRWNWI